MASTKELRVRQALRKAKVLTMTELTALVGGSERTIRRRLKEWGSCTSYNRRGRYYTLRETAKFDEHGLWRYCGICFSEYGNLKRTVIGIVERSEAGLSAFDISALVGIPGHTFLSHFKDTPELFREKYHGLYVYFSHVLRRQQEQRAARERLLAATVTEEGLPGDHESIIILVELIKHPHDDEARLVRRARRRGVRVSIDEVRKLLLYHGIKKKLWSQSPSGGKVSH